MNTAHEPLSAVAVALHRARHPQPIRLTIDSWHPYVGLVGVLLGSILATIGARMTSFGLADLRGGLHVGFDEGAWITTSFGVGQMLVGVASPYLGAVFGARRVLLAGIALFFFASLAAPAASNFTLFLVLIGLSGVGAGTFIPLTVSFIIRSLPAQLVVYGCAVYAMNSELSQNVAASLEGWYVDTFSWHWILWQYCVGLPAMFACIWFGVPREPVNTALLRGLDWSGLCFSGIGFSLLYAGLDQGNRLDWASSGLIVGLLVGGAVLTIAFLVRELTAKRPFVNLRLLLRGNLSILLLILAGLRYIILSTGYIIPSYLQTVQNFRELQIGKVLLWIALPQFVIVVPLALLLRKTHGRATLALGVTLIGIACLMTTRITADWATDEFLPSQILQAIGQSFALTAFTVLVVRNTVPSEALMIGSLLQTSRLFGGEIGTASMQTYVRVQEQIHSHYIGNQVMAGDGDTLSRLAGYQARIAASFSDGGAATMQSYKMLSGAIATQANVLAYRDGFASAACGALACLFFTALLSRRKTSPF